MYVIERTDQGGGYVTPPGSEHSYTKDVTRAQVFRTREAADRQRCEGNERVVAVESLFTSPPR